MKGKEKSLFIAASSKGGGKNDPNSIQLNFLIKLRTHTFSPSRIPFLHTHTRSCTRAPQRFRSGGPAVELILPVPSGTHCNKERGAWSGCRNDNDFFFNGETLMLQDLRKEQLIEEYRSSSKEKKKQCETGQPATFYLQNHKIKQTLWKTQTFPMLTQYFVTSPVLTGNVRCWRNPGVTSWKSLAMQLALTAPCFGPAIGRGRLGWHTAGASLYLYQKSRQGNFL